MAEPAFRLHLFGPPRLERHGKAVDLGLVRGLALLAYLGTARKPQSRDVLATLLWPEGDDATARGRLRRTAYEVNRAAGAEIIRSTNLTMALDDGVWVDALAFRQAAEAQDEAGLAAAIALHGDEFLAGFALEGSIAFDDWVRFERDALRHALNRSLARLAELRATAADWDGALLCLHRQLALDPIQEPVHRRAMEMLVRAGRPLAAIRQYEVLSALLADELGAAPDVRTAAVYRSISAAGTQDAGAAPVRRVDAAAPRTRYVRNGDVHIAYQVFGAGPVDLALVPGIVSHLEWAWQEPALSAFLRRLGTMARVIVFDRRGIGLSDRDGGPPSPEASESDLRAVLRAAGAERCVLLGCSEGGPIVARFAAAHPETARALILYGTLARGLYAPDHPHGLTRAQYDLWLDRLVAGWGGPLDLATFAPSMLHDRDFGQWCGALLRLGSSPGAIRSVLEAVRDTDVREILPSLRLPALVLHRTGDRAVRIGAGRTMAGLIPGASFVELPGEDHLWWVGDTERLLAEIARFLAALPADAAPRTPVPDGRLLGRPA